jgi:transposase
MVLLSLEGKTGTEISERLKVRKSTVGLWKKRFLVSGIGGLEDRQRPGIKPWA